MKSKLIFIAGGVMSGIGKGITNSSIGKILKSKGYKVELMKIDPYLNVDASTMNPVEHGEVFITNDGVECDQDIGNYERFLNQNFTSDNYITSGKIYNTVIKRERKLGYNGKCVQIVPDIPNEVIRKIKHLSNKSGADFILIEIGGTAGEYENLIFLETARMLKLDDRQNTLFILVSFLPVPDMIGEMKTKPTQHATRTLNSAGIQPDIIIARSKSPLDQPRKEKISRFCNVKKQDIISAPDVKSIYQVPINFEKDKLGNNILNKFNLSAKKNNMKSWKKMLNNIKTTNKKVKIGIVGKYLETGDFTLTDSYISVLEAIKHAAYQLKVQPQITWGNPEIYEKNSNKLQELKEFDGIIVPGGFGNRGIEGKIKVIKFARTNNIPFLGLCLGMQLSVIEFARSICGLSRANSREFSKNCKYPIIDIIQEQKKIIKKKDYGGTMRLGAFKCQLKQGTKTRKLYNQKIIIERHRHRYEVNKQFENILEKNGMIIAGRNPKRKLVEIIELKNHPYFLASQFHPEFRSRPLSPHPLFKGLIKNALKQRRRSDRP